MVGTITYDVVNNRMWAVGGTLQAPIGCIDLWNADKAGTLTLVNARNITGVDANPIAVNKALRPTDLYVLGGSKLYITVTNYSAPCTIRIVGTDANGNTQQEDIVINSNGNFNTTLFYHTVTTTQVTVFGGNFTYTLIQAQWGVFWKQGIAEFAFDCKLTVSDGSTPTCFADWSKLITFNDGVCAAYEQCISVRSAGTFTLGTLVNATTKETINGCAIINLASQITMLIYVYDSWNGIINLYDCSVISPNNYSIIGPANGTHNFYNFTMYNGIIGGQGPSVTVDLFNIKIDVPTSQNYPIDNLIGTFNRILLYGSMKGVALRGSVSVTMSNLTLIGSSTYDVTCVNTTADHYLVNCVLSQTNWRFYWYGTNTKSVYRQYEFDLTVTDATGAPINGATVTLKDKNGNTIFSLTTDANGQIATQTVSRGYYDQAHGDTLQDYSPHTLTITKAGCQTYVKQFTLTEKTKWEIKLAKAQAILLSAGNPIVNLNPANPENNNVLVM